MTRIDVYLTQNGFSKSRESAHRSIEAGLVTVDGVVIKKASFKVDETVEHDIVCTDALPYVGRGGLKLEAALDAFDIDPNGKICADIGASTGGFTDCMLQNGADKVFAVDVGYNQLDWRLRNHPQVVCMERTNARYLTSEQITQPLDFFSVDVSFISLNLILPALRPLMKESGEGVCLVKPQFEAGKDKVGKKGVVRDPDVHLEVLKNFLVHAANAGFAVKDITFSPIKGPEGNIEYLGYLQAANGPEFEGDLAALVEQSHRVWKEENE